MATENISLHNRGETPRCFTAELQAVLGYLSSECTSLDKELTVFGVGFEPLRVETLASTHDPESVLLGFVVPEEFDAVALVAKTARVQHVDSAHRPASSAGAGGGAAAGGAGAGCGMGPVLQMVTARDGSCAAQLVSGGQVLAMSEPAGWISDAMLRSLALATPPHGYCPIDLAEAIWLDRVMTTVLCDHASSGGLSWSQVANLCPLPAGISSSCVDSLAAALAESCLDWASAHQNCIDSSPRFWAISAALAKWMDVNMFARWAMASFVDRSELRADMAFLAPAWIGNQIDETISLAKKISEANEVFRSGPIGGVAA